MLISPAHRETVTMASRGLLVAILMSSAVIGQEWHELQIPGAWKSPLSGKLAPINGYGWFRSEVVLPASWKDEKVHILVEPIDDARAVYINGTPVGKSGEFPPRYRSGLGGQGRFEVPAGILQFGSVNQIAVKTYFKDGRSNFSVAAPALYTAREGIKLEGTWLYRPGDIANSATEIPETLSNRAHFDRKEQFTDLELYLRRRQGDHDPYAPADALASFRVADDLVLEQPLSDPDVQQPLFLNFDERGRLWVLEYRQYPDPAGLKMVSRDKYLRTVYDKVPKAPPHHVPGRDRISIHEDTNGDGQYDQHSIFVDGLNIATSFVQGRGGVWVLNPPYLLFYPDHDRDDIPDGDPVVHLQGFGLEDSHSVVNSLRWGPDGWLYAAQGSTVTGNITRPGINEPPVRSMGQLIWRYHPASGRYEVFSEGGGNTFGVEIDDLGRVFSGTNGGNARGYYYVQGGYSQKSFGKHGELSNPYAFGYFPAMKHHNVPRFTHNFIIYGGGSLPANYNGKLFGIEPLQGQLVLSDVQRDGSSFQTSDLNRPMTTDDQWHRPVDIKLGPDGGVYVADLYEQRIDHSSHYAGRIHRESGRIYRLRGAETERSGRFDYGQLTGTELLQRLRHPNRWHRQTAQRILADRADRSLIPQILEELKQAGGQFAVELLWALNHCGGLNVRTAPALMKHEEAFVRLWTVRLLADRNQLPEKLVDQVAEMARAESYVDVRSQLACSSRRLPPQQALPIVQALLEHDEDANDPHVPLLVWWAVESLAAEPETVIELSRTRDVWRRPLFAEHVAQRLMRRFALAGQRTDLVTCAVLLEQAPDEAQREVLLSGFEAAYKGRSMAALPDELVTALRAAGGGSLALRVRQQIPDAVQEAIERLKNSQTAEADRVQLADLLGEIRSADALPVLIEQVRTAKSAAVRSSAIASLQNFDHPSIADALIESHSTLPSADRRIAEQVLAARADWTMSLLKAIKKAQIRNESVPLETVRRILLHDNDQIRQDVQEIWGNVGVPTTAEMRAEVSRVEEAIGQGSGNPYAGRDLFAQKCGKCHILFGRGGQIGPDLTAYKRDDLPRVLLNVINPSAEIREGFENTLVVTSDGRLLNGFLADSDNRVVVLRSTDGQIRTIARDEIEEMQQLPVSVMPTELLKGMTEQELRDLFAFFRGSQPLP